MVRKRRLQVGRRDFRPSGLALELESLFHPTREIRMLLVYRIELTAKSFIGYILSQDIADETLASSIPVLFTRVIICFGAIECLYGVFVYK